MADDNDMKDRIEIEDPTAGQAGPGGKPADPIEKDEDFSSAAEPSAETEVSPELTAEERLQAKVADLEDRLLRAAADYDNARKRIMRQADDEIRAGNDRLLGELLDVMDNFERAFAHLDEKAEAASLKKGMELIYNQLGALLKKYDITPIEALGRKFDPVWHEAMMQVASEEHPEGIVAMEMARGYRQGERVLRHSKVGVSKGKG